MVQRVNANNTYMRQVVKRVNKRLPFTHVPRTVQDPKQRLQNRVLAGLHFLKAPMEAWSLISSVCSVVSIGYRMRHPVPELESVLVRLGRAHACPAGVCSAFSILGAAN